MLSIAWCKKKNGVAHRSRKEELRSYITQKEHVIFCESKDSDLYAYQGLDTERGFIFEPLRKYLADAWYGAGKTKKDLNTLLNNQMASHYLTSSQFAIPNSRNYETMQRYCAGLNLGYDVLTKTYGELQGEYNAIKQQYNARRRTFQLRSDTQYTDVWTYAPPRIDGRHVCEKPIEMMIDIVNASSKPGDRVLDAFCGSGVVGDACRQLGRSFVGIEQQLEWAVKSTNRIKGRNVFL